MNYKCVKAPQVLEIGGKVTVQDAVNSYAELINQEAVNGWEFHSLESIATLERPGCLASLMGQKVSLVGHNMLIFVKK